MESDLVWLPEQLGWHEDLSSARSLGSRGLPEALRRYRALACSRMDLALTVKLDRAVQASLERARSSGVDPAGFTRVRLALLGSSTLSHLLAGIRIAGLRRGLLIEVYQSAYGTWRQELGDRESGLHSFRPDALLLALDARHLVDVERVGGTGSALSLLRETWRSARETLGCAILQQTILPVFPPVLGNAEHLLPESAAAFVEHLNAELPQAATEADGVHLLALHRLAAEHGVHRWHSPGLWFRAKQEVHPAMAPVYGDHVARVVAGLLGQTAKCLVLDLDHTLWAGGIGDDGLEGIVVGQGTAAGEAHLELQRYALALRERGVLLAACSKNDHSNAILPFEHHPGMLLRREHFACFIANWDDKAMNLRRIASELNLGLDALVFVDDNPAERGLIRRELTEVKVPEMPEDPAEYVPTLAAGGYFELLGITGEDRSRANLYGQTGFRNTHTAETQAGDKTSLEGYLTSLNMELNARPFDRPGRARIVQLVNKTNQFNLTTRRVLDSEVDRLAADPDAITLQLRLRDIYGDHGMIAVVVAEKAPVRRNGMAGILPDQEGKLRFGPGDWIITQWLMSCRVLGRRIEYATLNLLVEQAAVHGVRRLLGVYRPTAKNGMVRELYDRMGFEAFHASGEGTSVWALQVAEYQRTAAPIAVVGEALALQPLG